MTVPLVTGPNLSPACPFLLTRERSNKSTSTSPFWFFCLFIFLSFSNYVNTFKVYYLVRVALGVGNEENEEYVNLFLF